MVRGPGLKSYDSGPQLKVKMDQGLTNDQFKRTCGLSTVATASADVPSGKKYLYAGEF